MQTVTVELGERSYPIHIGGGLLGQPQLLAPVLGRRDAIIVTNDVVGPLYLAAARAACGGRCRAEVVLPDGEAHKTMATIGRVLDGLVAARAGRDAVIVALGGGVVGDIAGFAAAIYQRGIDFIQVPTTLLAQVDSSVGGKTGVNHPGGKNLIGAFHQPRLVLADTDTLATLPPREYAAGLAEVVKYGLIADAPFFDWLEAHREALLARDAATVAAAIRRCCELKAAIVGEDEREADRRALLNLGHTFGHAIEVRAGYGEWLHGEAVAAGMVMAARFSARLGLLDKSIPARVATLLAAMGLPCAAPADDADGFLTAMNMDKKVLAGRLRLVLLDRIGAARLTADFPGGELEAFLREQLAA
jgi:3-dehydroquinate synthase